MGIAGLSLIGIALYLAAMLAVGYFSGRDHHYDGFVIGHRNVGLIPTAASLGAGFRDVAFIWFWFSLSYVYGYAPYLIFLAFIPGAFLIYFVGAKIRHLAKERNYISPG